MLILVNNQLDAQFFMYVYFYSVHVSDNHVPIIRRIVVSVYQWILLVCIVRLYYNARQINNFKTPKMQLQNM